MNNISKLQSEAVKNSSKINVYYPLHLNFTGKSLVSKDTILGTEINFSQSKQVGVSGYLYLENVETGKNCLTNFKEQEFNRLPIKTAKQYVKNLSTKLL